MFEPAQLQGGDMIAYTATPTQPLDGNEVLRVIIIEASPCRMKINQDRSDILLRCIVMFSRCATMKPGDSYDFYARDCAVEYWRKL